MSILPYLKPQLDGDLALAKSFYVAGKFPNGKPLEPYIGEIGIFNQMGPCTVRQIAGDTLPAGHSITCDGDRVRVTWPEYAEEAAPIINPGFENLTEGWTMGPGWNVTSDNAIAGLLSANYVDNTGESTLSSNTRYPAPQNNVPIIASCRVRQGASSAGNAGAAVKLEYRDASGSVVKSDEGNRVMSGSNNAVKLSTVTSFPPSSPGGLTVNIAGVGIRKRQNRQVLVDDFLWNLSVASSGVNVDSVFNITLEVTDSSGRVALWSGTIVIALLVARKAIMVAKAESFNTTPRYVVASLDGKNWMDPPVFVTPSDSVTLPTQTRSVGFKGMVVCWGLGSSTSALQKSEGGDIDWEIGPTYPSSLGGNAAVVGDRLLIYGTSRTVAYTEDGLTLTAIPGPSFITMVAHPNGTDAISVNNATSLYKTTDGGATWPQIATLPWGSYGTGFWFNGQYYLFDAIAGAPLGRSSSDGSSWSLVELPVFASPTAYVAMSAASEDIAVIMTSAGEIAYDDGDGFVLSPQTIPGTCIQITHNGIVFIAMFEADSAGPQRRIYTSANGRDWERQAVPAFAVYCDLIAVL